MTLLEKAKERKNVGFFVSRDGKQAATVCPHALGLTTNNDFCAGHTCGECYAREYIEPTKLEPAAPDEPMRHFDTGAVRDTAKGKGRYDLLPFAAIHALAQHCERGAEHYGERNVDKGIPQHSLIDSALRHIGLYVQGDAEDFHLVAALWNIAWACEQETKRPHMIDLPERTEASGRAI